MLIYSQTELNHLIKQICGSSLHHHQMTHLHQLEVRLRDMPAKLQKNFTGNYENVENDTKYRMREIAFKTM